MRARTASASWFAVTALALGSAGASAEPAARAKGEPAAGANGAALGMEQAVALALVRNRDVIAAKLDVKVAEYDRVQALLYPNPVLSYGVGNLVLGGGNRYNVAQGAPAHPGFFAQPVHTIGVSELIDVWSKRGTRARAAGASIRVKRLELSDALREIAYDVRSAFATLVREASERALAREVRARYDETVRLSRARREAGEISEAELRKIELEGLKYQSDVVDAELEYEEARLALAGLLGFGSAGELPDVKPEAEPGTLAKSLAELTRDALASRPDLRAVVESRGSASAKLDAAEREAYPDLTLGLAYTHSGFGVSGDNPNTLALSAAVPLPLFDRNQADVGRARIGVRQAENDEARLVLQIRREVAEAFGRYQRAEALLAMYRAGGMLNRAEVSLAVTEKSYRAGAVSLLELLEAQRTYLETRADYLKIRYDHDQAAVDLAHSLGKQP